MYTEPLERKTVQEKQCRKNSEGHDELSHSSLGLHWLPLIPFDTINGLLPPLYENEIIWSNYFIFMGYSRKMRSNQQSKPPPLIHMNPLSRNTGFAPATDDTSRQRVKKYLLLYQETNRKTMYHVDRTC